jgi:hypothetical protein
LILVLCFYRASKQNLGIKGYGWKKQAEDFVKLNIDATFSEKKGYKGATGHVIRDDGGSSRGIAHVADAAMTEAIALRDGLLLAV